MSWPKGLLGSLMEKEWFYRFQALFFVDSEALLAKVNEVSQRHWDPGQAWWVDRGPTRGSTTMGLYDRETNYCYCLSAAVADLSPASVALPEGAAITVVPCIKPEEIMSMIHDKGYKVCGRAQGKVGSPFKSFKYCDFWHVTSYHKSKKPCVDDCERK